MLLLVVNFQVKLENLTLLYIMILQVNDITNAENHNSWLPRISYLTYLDLSWSNLINGYEWLEATNKLQILGTWHWLNAVFLL